MGDSSGYEDDDMPAFFPRLTISGEGVQMYVSAATEKTLVRSTEGVSR